MSMINVLVSEILIQLANSLVCLSTEVLEITPAIFCSVLEKKGSPISPLSNKTKSLTETHEVFEREYITRMLN